MLAGELPMREQQIGEYVADIDTRGQDIPESKALRERHDFAPRAAANRNKLRKLKKSNRPKREATLDRTLKGQRLKVSRWVRRKPIPTL